MVKAGILEPAKVTRVAMQNNTRVATTFMTPESEVTFILVVAAAAPAGIAVFGLM